MKNLKSLLWALWLGFLISNFSSCSKDCDDTPTPATNNPIVVSLTAGAWDYYGSSSTRYYSPATGVFEFSSDGVKGYGETYRHGGYIVTRDNFDLNNKTLYMKWKTHNGGAFCTYAISLVYSSYIYSDAGVHNFVDFNWCSSPTVYSTTVLINNNTWYYTTVNVTNGQYITKTATSNYADNGGAVVENRTNSISNTKGRISLCAGDAYASTAAYFVVGELIVK